MLVTDCRQLPDLTLQLFYDHWADLAQGRPYPVWAEVLPERIPRPVLPHILVVDQLTDGDFRYRLSGTRVDDGVGTTVQKKRLSQLPLDRRGDLADGFRAVLQGLAVHYLELDLDAARFSYAITKRVLAPLSSDGGRADMILGAVVYGKPYERASYERRRGG